MTGMNGMTGMTAMTGFSEWIEQMSPSASVVISIAAMLMFGFLMTRITKRLRLPNVTAYIVTGILIGPYCLNLVPVRVVSGMDFLPDIALAFIAFSTGEFFRIEALRKNGPKVILITLFESCLASLFVFVLTFGVLHLNFSFSIVLGALAAATAPASTMMTIRQTGAHGDFVDTLLQVVALDDITGLIMYSIAISLAVSSAAGKAFDAGSVLTPVAENIGVILLGAATGVIMKFILREKRSTDNRLIIAIALIFGFCGICAVLDISPLLGCMSIGTVYINISNDDKLFKQLNYFSPPLLLLFFVRSGISFNLKALFGTSGTVGSVPLLTVGILYFLIRIAGKYAGAWLGCLITGKSASVRRYLGLALIPQAGVAIGLAALGARTLGGEMGNSLETIILASSVLYELIGPGCAKLSLYLSHSYSNQLEDLVTVSEVGSDGQPKSELDLLIERIRKIQETLPEHKESAEETAYNAAVQDQLDALSLQARDNARNLQKRLRQRGGPL